MMMLELKNKHDVIINFLQFLKVMGHEQSRGGYLYHKSRYAISRFVNCL